MMIAEKSKIRAAEAPQQAFLNLIPGAVSGWEAVSGGANSRAWRVETEDGVFFLKEYGWGGRGKKNRDRGASERAFYLVASDRAHDCVLRPVAWAPENRAGVFDWVEGRKLDSSEIGEEYLQQAFDFIARINQTPLPPGDVLPMAAESALSVEGHRQIIRSRLQKLSDLPGEVGAFARDELLREWKKIRKPLPNQDSVNVHSCISPSDFGFHNILMEKNGKLKFFDFEYAGWDDPAKLLADFFCQPQIPVAKKFLNYCLQRLKLQFPNDTYLEERFKIIFPMYNIKWVCIILNPFLLTNSHMNKLKKKETLEKASLALKNFQSSSHEV